MDFEMKKIRLKIITLLICVSLIIPITHAGDFLIDDQLEICPEEYEAYQLESHGDTLEINITANNSVNVVLFEEEEFSDYNEGREYENMTEVRDIKNKSFSVELPRGVFWLSVENSNIEPTEVSLQVMVVTEDETPGFTTAVLLLASIIAVGIYQKKSKKR